MAKVLFKRIDDSSIINNYPIDDGSFIVTKDGKVYVDYENERIPIIVKEEPPGTIKMYAGSTVPNGYLICDGSAISRTTYSNLFDVIGTMYGSGDGSFTFNLPDLKGKVPVGLDGNDTNFNSLSKTGGASTVTLGIEHIPPHKHSDPVTNGFGNLSWGYEFQYTNTAGLNAEHTQSVGGGQAHNNLQPYIVLNYIIKY